MSKQGRVPAGTFVVEQGNQHVLLLDLDFEGDVKRFLRFLPVLDRYYGIERIWIWPSKSKGTHARITLKNRVKEKGETIALQAILGSDPYREFFNLTKDDLGNVLFKPSRHRIWGDQSGA